MTKYDYAQLLERRQQQLYDELTRRGFSQETGQPERVREVPLGFNPRSTTPQIQVVTAR